METFVAQDSTTFQYTCSGNGTPVILMHGFTEDGRVWKNCSTSLEKKHKVLTPFLPTHQHGFCNSFIAAPSIEKLATYINELAEQVFSKTPTHFIGHSMGGYIGLAYTAAFPQSIRSLTLFHSTAYADSDEKKSMRNKTIEFIQKNGAAAFIKQSIPGLFSEKFKLANPAFLSEIINQYTSQTSENLICYLKAMLSRPDRTDLLQSDLPLLFIAGEKDTAVTIQQSMDQILSSDHLNYLVLEESGHMGMFEEPEKSISFLQKFLSSH